MTIALACAALALLAPDERRCRATGARVGWRWPALFGS